ncbi:inositol monophosphatase [Enterobacteriaceae endosymbiont of Macroplea mutica]|uniref:inositol monophosphatase family protein n=1 Tax=Enterobacteriaceae endosymbiont of Macroplea mutica TaxID=2675791 RepID=UPI001449F5A1|nr:inositol monophosphatase family protein [Enterobacteriaceae endosymbiont of Macroplea mutica]QJC31247.1 inositol monophosphatase [Enterobacteriaceae endosymbiont of Macroplea mutica]
MRPMLNVAIRIARQIGDIILTYYEKQKQYFNDEDYNIVIKNMIFMISRMIIRTLQNTYHQSFNIKYQKELLILQWQKTIWIINPLDGIENFIKKFPHFCTSIVILIKGKTELSLVYDPLRNDLFTAIRGQNTQLNGYKLRCHDKIYNSTLFITVNTNYLINNKYINIMKIFIGKIIILRMCGSIALDLAYLSANKINCYIYDNISHFYYFLAGELLIKESGGLITNLTGHCYYKHSRNILAAHSNILQIFLSKNNIT